MIGVIITKAVPILIGILIFGILILVHEWGHFIAAKKNGVLVEEFAMGMGPKLLGIQRGETLYSIRLFPIGGFCKMLGEDESLEEHIGNDKAFNNKKVWQRITVILAGAFMNMVLALVLFVIVVLFRDGVTTTKIDTVMPGSPAEIAGILPGDRIIKVDNMGVRTYMGLVISLQKNGDAVDVVFKRGNNKMTRSIAPFLDTDNMYKIGVRPIAKTGLFAEPKQGYERANILESVTAGYWQMDLWIKMTFSGIGGLITRDIPVGEMSGVIGVVSIIGETYEKTADEDIWETLAILINLAGVLSASIGIFNLLPLPALDGGRFVFLVIEGIRRKPIPPEKEGLVHFVGFVMLMALAVFIAYNDILKLL